MSDTTTTLRTYLCDDGNAEIEIRAESHEAAAREYVDGGDWGEHTKTDWVRVYVQEADEDGNEIGERECHTIAIEPDEPDCIDGHDHEWNSPYELLGGCKENPGVWGHGGGVVITQVCRHCGTYRDTDTWAQDMSTGEQGLTSIEYREADDASTEWVDGLLQSVIAEADVETLRAAMVRMFGGSGADAEVDEDGQVVYDGGSRVLLSSDRHELVDLLADSTS